MVALSIDLEKAFDSANLTYLNLVLNKMQFREQFMNAFSALYQNPTATLKVNNVSSDTINLNQGTRQGCPLSPLMFAIAIQPLAAFIRTHPEVQGIKIDEVEHKISLYDDNIVLYISEINTSLPVLQNIFQHFTDSWLKSKFLQIRSMPNVFTNR